MEGAGGVRAVDGYNVHAGQHLVEAVPVGRFQRILDVRMQAAAVVIVDRHAEGLGAPGNGLADPAHADDAEALAPDAAAHHPGGRPAGPFTLLHHLHAFRDPARHGEDQRHGHVGGVFGQHPRRVGDVDAAVVGADHVDVVDAIAEVGDELEVWPGLGQNGSVNPVRHGGNQHIGRPHGLHELGLRHRPVAFVEAGFEQLSHPRLDHIGKLARHDNQRLLLAHATSLLRCVEGALTLTDLGSHHAVSPHGGSLLFSLSDGLRETRGPALRPVSTLVGC